MRIIIFKDLKWVKTIIKRKKALKMTHSRSDNFEVTFSEPTHFLNDSFFEVTLFKMHHSRSDNFEVTFFEPAHFLNDSFRSDPFQYDSFPKWQFRSDLFRTDALFKWLISKWPFSIWLIPEVTISK